MNVELEAAAISEFLKNGWLISVHDEKILIGWGAWREGRSPFTESLEESSARSREASSAAPNGDASVSESRSRKARLAIYAPDFRRESSTPWRETPSWTLVHRDRLLSLLLALESLNVNVEDQGIQWVGPSLTEFSSAWQEIREGFSKRGLQKAVPVVFEEARCAFDEARVRRSLIELLKAPNTVHPYGFWSSRPNSTKAGGVAREGLLGATPEVLFLTRGREVATVALAGTRPHRGHDATVLTEELLADPKERHEHQLVVDDVSSVLGERGKVFVDSTRVLRLPSLLHLETPIRAELERETSFEELVGLLHPTPALGLSPRRLGLREMARWGDLERRRRFGAPFGVSCGFARRGDPAEIHGKCLVAIRNVQWQDDRVLLGSGCGVVPQSELDREWNELRAKRESVKRMMGL